MTRKNKRNLLGALLALQLTIPALSAAAPANPEPRSFVQPDGSSFVAVPRGDEWLAWYETPAGRIAVYNRNTHAYEYARTLRDAGRWQLAPSGYRVGSGLPANFPQVRMAELTAAWEQVRRAVGVFHADARDAEGSAGDGASGTATATGEPQVTATGPGTGTGTGTGTGEYPTLIVLVEFDDYAIASSDGSWAHKYFGGYPGSVAAGTVNDYYREVARGQVYFRPIAETGGTANDGVVRVHLSRNHPQYGRDWSSWRPVLYQALRAADAQVDFSAFDANADGALSKNELQLSFVVAGFESSWNGDESQGLWAHAWSFPDDSVAYPLLDNVKVGKSAAGGRYMAIAERHGRAGDYHDATIGIIAHEFGHSAFYLQDLYQDPYAIGHWGLMGTGSWGRKSGEASGATPVHPLGLSKLRADTPQGTGFLTARQIVPADNAQRLDLYPPLQAERYEVIRLAGDSASRYFAIEHRRAEGYDAGLQRSGLQPGEGGLLVTYYQGYGQVQVYRANGYDGGTQLTDLYFQGNNDRLAPGTTPSSATPDGNRTGYVLERISAPGQIMSLDIRKEAYACREYSATNPSHVSAGRAYEVKGSGWFASTEYYAVGSGDYLGTSSWSSVTLAETDAGHYIKGSCPAADTTAPVITLNGQAEVEVSVGASWSDPGATASDNVDGDISADIVVSGSVDTASVGTYTLRYNVSDSAGNAAQERVRTVRVVEQNACTSYTATVQQHIDAGRAYACGSWSMYGCAVGSQANIGSRYGSYQVTLAETAPGYYQQGTCP